MIQMKSANRQMHDEVEKKKNLVDAQKDRVDKAQLKLENLLYIQAHLNREIKACKDVFTPDLDSVEAEIGLKISTEMYSPDLAAINKNALLSLQEELAKRRDMQLALEALKKSKIESADQLEKKRKFLDDLPGKVSSLLTAANDLQQHYKQIKPLPFETSRLVRNLPSPLYTLYHITQNYILSLKDEENGELTGTSFPSSWSLEVATPTNSPFGNNDEKQSDKDNRSHAVDLIIRVFNLSINGIEDPSLYPGAQDPPATVTLRFQSNADESEVSVTVTHLHIPTASTSLFNPQSFLEDLLPESTSLQSAGQ